MCKLCNYGSNWKVKEGDYESTRLIKIKERDVKRLLSKGDIIEGCKYLKCKTCIHPDNPGRFETIVEEINCIKSNCPILKEDD